jgi:adenylyltransferase/sulfurtransferase
MKKFRFVFPVLMGMLLFSCSGLATDVSAFSGEPVININPNEVKTKVQTENAILIDVRTAAERNKKNIGGLHIPLDKIGSANMNNIPQQSIVFYCATGVRSREAMKVALHLWPEKTFYQLKGGIDPL